jgi:chromosome segregation ATPase
MNSETTDEFVSNASMKPKNIGHNKFQIKIVEANSQIEELSKNLEDKNNEIEQLKSIIDTSRLHLNEKESIIQILTNKLDMTSSELNNLTDDLHNFKLDTHDNINTYECDKNQLINEIDALKLNVSELNATNEELSLKYQDLKKKYQITLDLLETKAQHNDDLTNNIYNLTNELNIYKDNCSKQLSDITSLKQELLEIYDINTTLKFQISEKDDYLGQLHKKLACQKIKVINIDTETDNTSTSISSDTKYIYDTNDTIDTTQISRQIKVSSNRGIKISKR